MSFEDDVNYYAAMLAINQQRAVTEADFATVYTLLKELEGDNRLLPGGGMSHVEFGLLDTKATRRNFPVYIGNSTWAMEHGTHRRTVVAWPGQPFPNDCWGRYRSPWMEMERA